MVNKKEREQYSRRHRHHRGIKTREVNHLFLGKLKWTESKKKYRNSCPEG